MAGYLFVDIEAFRSSRQTGWDRLAKLAKARHLTGAEADELVRLYQRGSTDLAALRSRAPDPALISRLSMNLALARTHIVGRPAMTWGLVRRLFEVTMPLALHRLRWWLVGAAVAMAGLAVIGGVWAYSHPEALAVMGTAAEQQDYVDRAFADYYSQYAHASFSAMVWTNNAWIALLLIASGITLLIPVYIFCQNAIALGFAAALMISHGASGVFFSLILPHGVIELSSVCVAAAAGVHLFWTWLVPGPRPRAQALAEQGRATGLVGLAMVLTLLVAGIFEGFVTPSGLPWPVKDGLGVVAGAGFWAYVFIIGRRANRLGLTTEAETPHYYQMVG